MSSVHAERRKERSDRPIEALTLQLSHLQRASSMEALVLANDEGLVIAQAGNDDVCRELAAIAPLVSQSGSSMKTAIRGPGMLHIRKLAVAGMPLYLASSQGVTPQPARLEEADGWMSHASQGVSRILVA